MTGTLADREVVTQDGTVLVLGWADLGCETPEAMLESHAVNIVCHVVERLEDTDRGADLEGVLWLYSRHPDIARHATALQLIDHAAALQRADAGDTTAVLLRSAARALLELARR